MGFNQMKFIGALLMIALLASPGLAAVSCAFVPTANIGSQGTGKYTVVNATTAHHTEGTQIHVNCSGWDANGDNITIFFNNNRTQLSNTTVGAAVSTDAGDGICKPDVNWCGEGFIRANGTGFLSFNLTIPGALTPDLDKDGANITLDGNTTAANYSMHFTTDPNVVTVHGFVKWGTSAQPGDGLSGLDVTVEETTYPYVTKSNKTVTTNSSGGWTTGAVISEGTTLISLEGAGRVAGYGTSPVITADTGVMYYVNETSPLGRPIVIVSQEQISARSNQVMTYGIIGIVVVICLYLFVTKKK